MLNDWRLFALGAAGFAALTAIFGKIGVAELNSNLATWVRTVVILIFVSFMLAFQSGWKFDEHWSSRAVMFLVLSGLATGASWLCYFRALQLGPVSSVAPIDKLSVVFTVIIAATVLGEPTSLKLILGTALIAAGSIVIAL